VQWTTLRTGRVGVVIAFVLASAAPAVTAPVAAARTPEPYRPRIVASDFSTTVDNPWFPLTPGTIRVYEGTKDAKPARTVVTVTNRTRRIRGVRTVVVSDNGFVDGRLRERTLDYFAQDARGNVWYFGEDTATLDRRGKVRGREGTWHAGRDGAQPGVVMQAAPVVGRKIRQEYLKGHAEDWYETVNLSTPVTVPYGTFDALETHEWTPLEPKVLDRKTYARGIGELSESSIDGPPERAELVEVRSGEVPTPGAPGAGRPSTAVPVTWSPRSFVARNSISTRPSAAPSPGAREVPVTTPVNTSVDPGCTGTPSRMERCRTIASGPAQSVRNRLQ
jgi:hypothetical protein